MDPGVNDRGSVRDKPRKGRKSLEDEEPKGKPRGFYASTVGHKGFQRVCVEGRIP
jgi:hypothetical protein